jgi:hypothetical protein
MARQLPTHYPLLMLHERVLELSPTDMLEPRLYQDQLQWINWSHQWLDYWAEQRILLSQALQGCYKLCGPLQQAVICLPPRVNKRGANFGCQEIV